MNYSSFNLAVPSIYPGEYVPLVSDKEIIEELNHLSQSEINQPAVNIREEKEVFNIEVAIPGVDRAEMVIYAHGTILSVCTAHKHTLAGEPKGAFIHEFSCDGFDRQIELPENADTEFASAEYKSGILHLCLAKVNKPVKNPYTRIAVY